MLNNKKIGQIIGIKVKLLELESYKKDKFIYEKVNACLSKAINEYITTILNRDKFQILISKNLNILYQNHKIASVYKGETVVKPNLLISDYEYISKKNYSSFLKKKFNLI